jgi:hypothetical protein
MIPFPRDKHAGLVNTGERGLEENMTGRAGLPSTPSTGFIFLVLYIRGIDLLGVSAITSLNKRLQKPRTCLGNLP